MAVPTALEENHIDHKDRKNKMLTPLDHEPNLWELTLSLSRRDVVVGTLLV